MGYFISTRLVWVVQQLRLLLMLLQRAKILFRFLAGKIHEAFFIMCCLIHIVCHSKLNHD